MSSSTVDEERQEELRDTDQDEIDAFLREEGLSPSSNVTADDIVAALVSLGYTVATASVKFIVKVAIRRLDTLACVEGELRKDAASASANGALPSSPPSCSRPAGPLRWCRHLMAEDRSVTTFLRGGWAEFGFVLATSLEESAIVMGLGAVYSRLNALASKSAPRRNWTLMCTNVLAPMFLVSLLSWPLRAVRTAVMVNYIADTTVPPPATTTTTNAAAADSNEAAQRPPHQYGSAVDVWRRLWQRVGLRSLLRNGLDVDMAGRVLSMTLVWSIVQPTTRWIRQVAVVRARAEAPVTSAMPDAALSPSSSPLLLRLGQSRYFNLAALLVVVGTVNTLQRPFVVLRQRMALMPREEKADGVYEAGAEPARCRYASGWDCAKQVVQSEGVSALFAGLLLCLLTSTVVPLVVTFAGFATAPAFSGTAV